MITIRDVIKDREPYCVSILDTVQDAAEFMADRNIGAVCVLNENGNLVGIFSERDLLNRVVAQRIDPTHLTVGAVMSELKAQIRADETPHEALQRMESIGCRHLPVVDGGRWIGMLSIRDLLKVEVNEQVYELQMLHEYISH
jgi:CBS domain-containing protein